MPPGPPGPALAQFGGVLFGAFLGIAVCIIVLVRAMYGLNARHGLKNGVTRRTWIWGLSLQAIGLLLLWSRSANVPILTLRFWIYLQLAAEVVAALYLLWWLRARFPNRLAAYEWEEKKRAYLPRAAGGSVEPLHRRAAPGRR